MSGSQRRRLLDAMAELCAEKGYPEVRIAEVVERARVSRATFYELFKDKEDCFVETMEEAFKHLTDRVMPAVYRQEGPWHERVAGVVEALLDYFASDPAYSKAALVEALAGGERAYERYMAGATLIMSLIDQGRNDVTHDAPLPSKTARAVLGACESLVVAEMMAGRTERVRDLLPDFIYVVLTPYLGQAEAIRMMEQAAGRRR